MSDLKPSKTETNIHKEADMALDTTKTSEAATPVTTQKASISAQTEAFMSSLIKDGRYENTPRNMLFWPGVDIGLGDIAEEWITEIIESEEPDVEMSVLINHLTGGLRSVKLIRKRYIETIGEVA